ncbi:cobalt-precorrin 5A hydrolase [Azotosporobacter soli]|uniref:cobalt-precorrin 5A hydrolase n=1 Tax=Azotosporobacter soli TaxID=3055040 RepID=UPI0031FEFBD0
MKLALLSVTTRGAFLANTLATEIRLSGDEADCFEKQGRSAQCGAEAFDSLSELLVELWPRYDGFIFIMATGIVVRVIAPHIVDKRQDPAVIVLDEQGIHAISLLSGHLGQANCLASSVAKMIGAKPVITTATDLAGKTAPDVLAVALQCKIEPFDRLKKINAALAAGDTIIWQIDERLTLTEAYRAKAAEYAIELLPWQPKVSKDVAVKNVLISDRAMPCDEADLFLRPPILAAGIGCRRGVPASEIIAAIEDACRSVGRSPACIAIMASVDVKSTEKGLLEAAATLAAKTVFFSADELAQTVAKYNLKESDFVRKQIGVGNICEAAVMKVSQEETLLVPRTRYPQITIALAEVTSV